MREILFRGKRTDNGDWHEGEDIMRNTIRGKVCLAKIGEDWISVDPETVGQYTGLCDKNVKRVFEGDIMRNAGNVVEFCGGNFCINGDSPLSYWTRTEVIGNIHDNPELMKGGEGGGII